MHQPLVRHRNLATLALLLLLGLWMGGCGGDPQGDGPQPAGMADEAAAPNPTSEANRGTLENGDDDTPVSPRLPLLDRRARPATTGLDSTLLAQAVERAEGQANLHNMIVARHGEVVLERHFRGPGPSQPANVKSASKSLLSAVVGAAVRDGHLESAEEAIGPHLGEHFPSTNQGEGPEDDPRWNITVGQLLSMSSGLESTSFGNYGAWVVSSNWVRSALARPMTFEPGSRMLYSTGNTHLVSALLTRATGRSTHAYAREVLAEPLGIQLPPWPRDAQGIYFGGNDMLVSPRGLLRFGELYRQGGRVDGRQVLPREWIEESWEVRVRSRRDGNGYGLGWWARDAGAYEVRFAWGYGGQFLFVVPELELTVVFTSDPWSRERGHNRVLHGLVDDFLVPAAARGG